MTHYFSEDPGSPERRRTVSVDLAGRVVELVTAAGVFAGDGLDRGTAVLLRESPMPTGRPRVLDLGCGYGPIAAVLATESPRATVWAVDVNSRARELTAENAETLGLANLRVAGPEEVPGDVVFDQIWSNPPTHVGKAELRALMERWLPRLAPDGAAWLVINRHLGGDSLHAWLVELGWHVERMASQKGFRVLRVGRKTG